MLYFFDILQQTPETRGLSSEFRIDAIPITASSAKHPTAPAPPEDCFLRCSSSERISPIFFFPSLSYMCFGIFYFEINLAICFAKISNSILAKSPFFIVLKLVCSNVYGIIATENSSFVS